MVLPWWMTLGIIVFLGTMAWGGLLAAPWLPMPKADVRRMLALAGLGRGELLYDLGCGDGRILAAAARLGAPAIGFEVSLLPYLLAWGRILGAGQWRRAKVRYRNFFNRSLSDAAVVTTFLTPRAMVKLGPKLAAELRSGARVVSYAFPIVGWQPSAVSKPTPTSVAIYRYDIGGVTNQPGQKI
ncbi:MAG: putative RNA methylase [Parcubacteria group bacterium Gr01-1014_31]|nr:MAG: putative RNA methylase [Parcubacteria group bacterium Gr01-1014_31]